MNETAFHRLLMDELSTLLAELGEGRRPTNIFLHEVVARELRRQQPNVEGSGASVEQAEARAEFERKRGNNMHLTVHDRNSNHTGLSLRQAGWFEKTGAYVLVDGQYGSTGKGLMASVLASAGLNRITHITTNAGPNSGHTAYIDGNKVMTQQVPIAAVALEKWLHSADRKPAVYLNAGAIIDPAILSKELHDHRITWAYVHPSAAVIRDIDRNFEASSPDICKVASTGKGTGSALAAKVLRENNVAGQLLGGTGVGISPVIWDWKNHVVFVETAQGFSLGINEHRFHPFTTSRECTVMQAIADARIPHNRVRNVCACYRTFPIRVGHTDLGQSGGYYPDQEEISWEALGVEPELTSVTKRVRRVFTWSAQQFRESVAANEPDTVFLNFLNYLPEGDRRPFVETAIADYEETLGRSPKLVLVGYGPHPEDVKVW